MRAMLYWLVLPYLQHLQHRMDRRYLDLRVLHPLLFRLQPQRVWLIASEASLWMSFIKSRVSTHYTVSLSHTHKHSLGSVFVVISVCVCVVSVPSWALVAFGFLVVLIIFSCCLCFCRKMIFKKKKEKGGKEKNEKNTINMSSVREEGTKQVQIIKQIHN